MLGCRDHHYWSSLYTHVFLRSLDIFHPSLESRLQLVVVALQSHVYSTTHYFITLISITSAPPCECSDRLDGFLFLNDTIIMPSRIGSLQRSDHLDAATLLHGLIRFPLQSLPQHQRILIVLASCCPHSACKEMWYAIINEAHQGILLNVVVLYALTAWVAETDRSY
jgi:hypothetical protein